MSELIFDPEKWYTTSQAVELARQGYSPFRSLGTLYEMIHSGKIQVVVRGTDKKKKFFVQGKELQKYAESQQTKLTDKPNDKPLQKNSS